MTITQDVTDFLTGGDGRSAQFENIGDAVRGTIVAAEQRQQTDYHTKLPKTWDDGTPAMQVVITIQTELREDGQDDGKRLLYIKGSKKSPTSTAGAIIVALKAAGVTTIAEGGTIAMQWIAGAGKSGDPRQWKIAYKAPDPVAVGDLLDPEPAAPAPASSAFDGL